MKETTESSTGNNESSSNKNADKVHTKKIGLSLYSKTATIKELKKEVEKMVEIYQKFIVEDIDQNQYYFITKLEKPYRGIFFLFYFLL